MNSILILKGRKVYWSDLVKQIQSQFIKHFAENSESITYFFSQLDKDSTILQMDDYRIIIGYPDSYRFSIKEKEQIISILEKTIKEILGFSVVIELEMI